MRCDKSWLWWSYSPDDEDNDHEDDEFELDVDTVRSSNVGVPGLRSPSAVSFFFNVQAASFSRLTQQRKYVFIDVIISQYIFVILFYIIIVIDLYIFYTGEHLKRHTFSVPLFKHYWYLR